MNRIDKPIIDLSWLCVLNVGNHIRYQGAQNEASTNILKIVNLITVVSTCLTGCMNNYFPANINYKFKFNDLKYKFNLHFSKIGCCWSYVTIYFRLTIVHNTKCVLSLVSIQMYA